MDVIRYTNPNGLMRIENGFVVNGLKTKMWVERYLQPGEFKFTCPATLEMRERLPIGTFVTHGDTEEVMIIENHEIREVEDQSSELVVTGRGIETLLERRVVGINKAFPTSGDVNEYIIPANYVWSQAIDLVNGHIDPDNLVDDGNTIQNLVFVRLVDDDGSDSVSRSIKRGNLHARFVELLASADLGVKVIRPRRGPYYSTLNVIDTYVGIHKGSDKTSSVLLSEETGEIVGSEYLWSDKSIKNCALITGRWVETTYISPEVDFSGSPGVAEGLGVLRRWMHVEAEDIDDQFEGAPGGGDLATIVAKMQLRGQIAIASQKQVALTKVDVSKQETTAKYRVDFDLGDLIRVKGSYNESTVMRVTEYVEIEDETGNTRYPTLELIQ